MFVVDFTWDRGVAWTSLSPWGGGNSGSNPDGPTIGN